MKLPENKLTDIETVELLKKSKKGCNESREKLITSNLRLVMHVVKKYENKGTCLEDLFQVGCMGLIKAVDKFEFGHSVKFSTFATVTIGFQIKRHFRDKAEMIHVSRGAKEKRRMYYNVKDELSNVLGREPSLKEISVAMNISEVELADIVRTAYYCKSIDSIAYRGEIEDLMLADMISDGVDYESIALNGMTVDSVLTGLSVKEKLIIRLRYFMEKTQREVAAIIGVSQVQVSRIEKRVLQKMRERLVYS